MDDWVTKKMDLVEVNEILGSAIVGKRKTKRCTNLLKILITTGGRVLLSILLSIHLNFILQHITLIANAHY